ncbi:hypothetical protein PA598K_02960 [Paenibacillus sp. 598K]|uniref:hypothetical protein n=1 Tax=Paenibacillus sp. 598K TaxID=1117987 RepID=UPI000FF9713B|nr:hypothetical protein [Paenibacillus sp. 598K]GBF74603.1 hypothetical protein PA598K_02960 [Paenibacillus sp. 598K]
MKKQRWLAGVALALMVALSACGNSDQAPEEKPDNTAPATNEQGTGNVDPDKNQNDPANNSSNADPETSSELPANLPSDFPLPEDAKVTTATSGENEGKKNAMIIFTTEQDMKQVTSLYKKYFESKLSSDSQLIDEKNIVFQGTDTETGDSWSMIGGLMASQEGVIELTVTWAEN